MSATQKLLRFGVYEMNLDTVELRKSGTLVKLPPQPFKLLALLVSRAGQTVSRDEIKATLWGDETYVDFEHGVNKCIKQIRKVLGDDADQPLYVETLPRQGYRFLAPVVSKTIAAPAPRIIESTSGERGRPPVFSGAAAPAIASLAEPVAATATIPAQQAQMPHGIRLRYIVIPALLLLLATIGGVLYWRLRPRPVLTDKDLIVLADFDNQTGDPVFNDALKQALAFQLEQSPFLHVLSDSKVADTLKLMSRPANERLLEPTAREVCLRTNSRAVLAGSIAAVGNRYLIGIKAIECDGGDVLAEAQAEAPGKDAVLKAVDGAAIAIRGKLGESLASVQKYATPLPEATTSSLDALQAYAEGQRISRTKGEAAALPFYEKAVELDPNFALGYADLASCYRNLNQPGRAADNAQRAYELRGKVSERERFIIETAYYEMTTGELEKAEQVYEAWVQNYPNDVLAAGNLGIVYAILGNWPAALDESIKSMRLAPDSGIAYVDLGNAYTNLNRMGDAEKIYDEAEKRGLDTELLPANRYLLAFFHDDQPGMAQLASAAMKEPGAEDFMLSVEANTEFWHGRFRNGRELTQRAMRAAQRNDATEAAAMYQVLRALYEVAAGDREGARADALAALKLAPTQHVREVAALALAQAGDLPHAQKLAAELDREFPSHTLVQKYWLPPIRAAIALDHNNARQALQELDIVNSIEFGGPTEVNVYLAPAYLRGQAYLALHDGPAAAAEFQKFIDYYGLVGNFPWGALARLGLARAYAIQGEQDRAARDKARAAYQDFLALWKDADPDIPIYQQAKAEYARLR